MSREHVDHNDLVTFAQDKVNLPKNKVDEYRAQVRILQDKLESILEKQPDFSLRRMLVSGSLAKGTALRSINDIDVACYISGADTTSEINELLDCLAERLRSAFPNFSEDQVQSNTYSITVSFKGTGLDLDVVPILYDGDPEWHGNLVSQEDGSFLETCIPHHLEFIRKRKESQKIHFAQVVRLLKYWVRNVKKEDESFRFKSFMIELILSHLCDKRCDLSNYPDALQEFFTYVVKSNLDEVIFFSDYYDPSEIDNSYDPIRIFDPVNPENNAARLFTSEQKAKIIDVSLDAGDAIDAALAAPTKQQTIYYWQKVFGPSFQI